MDGYAEVKALAEDSQRLVKDFVEKQGSHEEELYLKAGVILCFLTWCLNAVPGLDNDALPPTEKEGLVPGFRTKRKIVPRQWLANIT